MFIGIIGWTGTFLIVFAYFLISYKKISSGSMVFQMMNLFVAIGVGTYVFYQKSWPALVLQIIWGGKVVKKLV